MRKVRLFFWALVCSTTMALAQNAGTANRLFEAGDYAAAQRAYQQLLAGNPKSPLYTYRYARCAQELGDYTTAIAYFDRAGDRYPLKYFYLGEIYMQTWQADEAIAAYEAYLRLSATPNDREPYIRMQIRKAEKRQRYLRRVERVEILDSLEVSLDSLLSACILSAEAGTLLTNEQAELVYTNQRGDRRLWSAPCDSTWKIVSSHRLLDQWTTPDTLPDCINMASRQCSPYVLSDGVTLYFASNDTNGLGGLDLYVSRYNTTSDSYTHPENLGFPYNSEANEYLMVIDEARHIGYFATDRFSPAGRARVYSFVYTEQKTYWRNLPQDSLVAHAQLRCVLQADSVLTTKPTIDSIKVPNSYDNQSNSILFILNDSTVYYSETEFRSSEALALFRQWQTLQRQTEKKGAHLNRLRQEYLEADAAQRRQMAAKILQMEQALRDNAVRTQSLLNTVRQTEAEAVLHHSDDTR